MRLFSDSLTMRYDTLERNIKSKSNSFYDAYLDLLETTIKCILDDENIEYDSSRTCGYLIKSDYIRSYFMYILKLDDYTYNKLPDYIKKCNDHKHKKEKNVSIEAIINYLKVYFDLYNYYSCFKKYEIIKFDASYYDSIFGETERINSEYKRELMSLKKELRELYDSQALSEKDVSLYESIINSKNLELSNLDEQNQMLQIQLNALKDIKINSLEEKINNTIDNLHALGLSIKDNHIFKEVFKDTKIMSIELDANNSKNGVNKAINKTKETVDKINEFSKKGKAEIDKINNEIQTNVSVIEDNK